MEISTGSPNGSADGTARTRRITTWLARRAGVALVFAALPVLSGCAANFGAQTQVEYQPGVGSDERSGDVYVINALVVADDDGNGTLVTSLINQKAQPDYLTEFQATDSKGGGVETSQLPSLASEATAADPDAPSKGVALPSQQPAKLPDDALLQVRGTNVAPGGFLTLSFRFRDAAPLEIGVPVVPESSVYDGVTIGPIKNPEKTGASDSPATPSQ